MKILLVDDTEDMRRLVELFLKMLHHEVESAEDGQVAFEKFQKSKYDVILMDMRMPRVDGYEATRKIREYERSQKLAPTVIIALTSFSTQEEISKSIEAGCDSHLVKPVSKDSLDRALLNLPQPTQHSFNDDKESDDVLIVKIDPDLEDLVPGYLEKRHSDLAKFKDELASENFEELRSMGHKIKGSGGGYGFTELSKIGASIEIAAKARKIDDLEAQIKAYASYLERVQVVYEEE